MSGLLIACRPSCTRASLFQLRENMAHAYVSHNRRRVRRSPDFETVLLDDLVRPQQRRRRDRQAEGFGGLEIDHRGYSKAMTAIPAATWMAPFKSSTPR